MEHCLLAACHLWHSVTNWVEEEEGESKGYLYRKEDGARRGGGRGQQQVWLV
jgi:hypothetical protein